MTIMTMFTNILTPLRTLLQIALTAIFYLSLTACSYNPLSGNNHNTGTALGTISGAAIGAGSVGILGGSKPLMGVAAIAGGAIGYYVTTLRYDAGGIYQAGGQVYQVGDYIGIYIPTDNLFEPNTAEFLPQAAPILDSTADVLERFPSNNILISGNTSGFGHSRWEQRLSERRAEKVSAYLWNAGVNDFVAPTIDTRRLNYVGYGDYLPIASNHSNPGIRENSRIQITSYPCSADLHLDRRHLSMHNFGEFKDTAPGSSEHTPCKNNVGCYESTL